MNARGIDDLLAIMARLRDPDGGCPWDITQSFDTVYPYTLEEAYEVADAIKREDFDDLRDELGDLLLNIVFHAQMARERSLFDFADVVESICEKMVRRHPHVFDTQVSGVSDKELRANWESQKAAEREEKSADGNTSALAGVALALPALMRAQKIGRRASRVGFDWDSIEAVMDKIREELEECEEAVSETPQRIHEEVGDLLFAVVNLARHTGVDAEHALRQANDKFQARFEEVETAAAIDARELSDCDAAELDRYWRAAKAAISKNSV